MSNNTIRIALTKGRIEKQSLALFRGMGWDVSELDDKGRKLIFGVSAPALPDRRLEVVLAKSSDVITYVETGVCDMGITGKDMIMEYGGQYYEMLDLGIGKCRFALAGKVGYDVFAGSSVKTIASKYTVVTRRFFESRGMDVDIVKIEGSVELAPLIGLADGIVDLVETGATLKENGLEVKEVLHHISTRVIVNPAKMKMKKQALDIVLRDLSAQGLRPAQRLCP